MALYIGNQKVAPTIMGGVTPTGTISITADGVYNVKNYATAVVSVSSSLYTHLVTYEDRELDIDYENWVIECDGESYPLYMVYATEDNYDDLSANYIYAVAYDFVNNIPLAIFGYNEGGEIIMERISDYS